ncbi:hypothetical protein IWW36_000034 [Coemansia brasiliensis]|uniref:Nucleoside transporter n=1 Tax=Coemansia brasiliensis TaxID=2650707 RepID=A0A9W8IBS1_9FUNG|nr:hypothetical protein IWW36_000034 [Coemansia brasiliensis]
MPAADFRPSAEESESDTAAASTDRVQADAGSLRIAYVLFLGMGLATLLPWNLFISASEFFKFQFGGSSHQQTFQNSFSVVYMVTNFASNIYAMLTVTRSSPNKRIVFGLTANTLSYAVGIVMPFMAGLRGSVSFYIALVQLATCAVASGMLTNSLFALVAHFPAAHAEGILSGQAVAGIMATVAQLLTAYSVSPSAKKVTSFDAGSSDSLIPRTVAYFVFATAVNLALTAMFWHVSRDPYYRQQSKLAYSAEDTSDSLSEETEQLVSIVPPSTPTPALASDINAFKHTFSEISGYCYVIVLDFALTLSVFPSVTALVTSTSGFQLLTEWHFLIYNIGDFIGRRFAPSIGVSKVSSLMFLAGLRVLLIPAFFACHVSFSVWYNGIRSDNVFLVLVLLLGTTNGFLSTRAAMTAPGLSVYPTIAGSIVAISISSGLALGALLSWPVRAAGCLCIPF